MDITRAMASDRLMKSVTGMTVEEFKSLAKDFGQVYEKKRQEDYEKKLENWERERRLGGGRKGKLATVYEKLFFILFYFKCYPTFDLLGFLFDIHRANSCRNVHKLLTILEKTLGKKMVLPKREIHTIRRAF